MLILFTIALNKKPDHEKELDFEELVKNFYDHIKLRGCTTKCICKYYSENKIILSDVSIPHMGFDLMMSDKKNVFSMLCLFSQCKEWFDYYVFNFWDMFPKFEQGRIFENKNQITMKVLFDKVPSSAKSCLVSNNQLKLYLFTQSLLWNVLEDVISEEAKAYFRHNLKIISIKEMRKIQPEKHFNIKFTTDSKGPKDKKGGKRQ